MVKSESPNRKADGAQVFEAVWRAYRILLGRGEESFRATGLGDSDFRVLRVLFEEGTLPVNVIGDKVSLTTGSITTAIDRMETKALVARKPHPSDRRVRLVELTTKGKRLIEKCHEQHLAEMDRAITCLNKEERAALIALLNRVSSESLPDPKH